MNRVGGGRGGKDCSGCGSLILNGGTVFSRQALAMSLDGRPPALAAAISVCRIRSHYPRLVQRSSNAPPKVGLGHAGLDRLSFPLLRGRQSMIN